MFKEIRKPLSARSDDTSNEMWFYIMQRAVKWLIMSLHNNFILKMR